MTQKATGSRSDVWAPDFLDFVACLSTHNVDVVLVGGYAVALHGFVRATGDIDFLYRRNKKNVARLRLALMEFGAPPEVLDEEALMSPNVVTQFGIPPFRIDLLNQIDGVTVEEVWKGAEERVFASQTLRVIGLADLLRNKAATGRPKDREDLRQLKAIAAKKR